MTNMGNATRKVSAAIGASLVAAAATVALGAAPANAEPAAHQVRYTLTSGGPYSFQVLYLTAQPPSMAAYNADAYSYVKRDTITVGPDAPFVFETTLADPQWAILQVSSTAKGGQAPPNAHCEIAIDGQIAVQQDHPYSPTCQLSQW